jgi:hypothetical protein
VLDQHRDVVTSYTVDETSINAWFKDLNFFYSIKVGRQFPPEPVKMKDKETVRQEQEERFWKTYHSGCWVCWGVGYGVDVPRAWQPKTAAVIDSVHALMSTGATGDGLRAAISRLDGKNTPLECEDFLKDLLDPGRR